jgi:hypothetical protein
MGRVSGNRLVKYSLLARIGHWSGGTGGNCDALRVDNASTGFSTASIGDVIDVLVGVVAATGNA